jgi:hypothetical protein
MKRLSAFALTLSLVAHAQSTQQAPPNPPPAERALPDDNLAYPVLITIGASVGSGFFFNAPTAVYLVTAKHVLFDPNGNKLYSGSLLLLSHSKDPSDATPNRFVVDTTKLPPGSIINHPSEDVVVIKLFSIVKGDAKSGDTVPMPGVDVLGAAREGIVGASRDAIKLFADVLVGNDAMLAGYPVSLGLQQVPQLDLMSPLLRKGIVAGKNLPKRSIILDCPSYPGNSGGPAIEIDQHGLGLKHFSIIGIVIQYVPYADGGRTFTISANSGYSVVTPIDFVLELIK